MADQAPAEKDHAYREQVKEKIVSGVTSNRVSIVTIFANTMLELQVPAASVTPAGYAYKCGCGVRFLGAETTIAVCEAHR